MTDTRFGVIALIGPSNVGKSTLVNALLGQKIAIVTHKAQTTRTRLRAVFMHKQAQIVLIDTPGIFAAHTRLDKAMLSEAYAGAAMADALALMLDAGKAIPAELVDILTSIRQAADLSEKPLFLILNKVDMVRREKLLVMADELSQKTDFKEIFMISALQKTALDKLADCFAKTVPAGPWHYPQDMAADIPSVLLSAEITREKLLMRLHQEVPYALTVETEDWTRHKNGSVKIAQVIYVRRATHKAIILGRGGSQIKKIGIQARREMENLFGHKVHLSLFVKVRENWMEDPERYRMMGFAAIDKKANEESQFIRRDATSS